jgi:micrococcal nuclease
LEIRLTRTLAIFLLLTGAAIGSTEVYVRDEPGGQRHYSDKPFANAHRLEIPAGVSYRVVRTVYDGDTLLLDNRTKVRLLGINSPEIETPRKSGEAGGEEARIWLKKAIEGKKIRLEVDIERTDRYKRTLAHVFAEDGTHINMALLRLGLAAVDIHPPNLKYVQQLLNAQQLAETARIGIWGNSAYKPQPLNRLPGSKDRGWRRFTGQPVMLKPSRKFYRLIYSEQVDVRIARENMALFPDLMTYVGRDTEIRGWPSRRRGHYSIFVRHPSALRLMEKE